MDALALDPQNPELVYAAVGAYTNSYDPNNGAIIKSTDQGATWTFANLSFKVGGNMPGRGTGERLAVDPQNSNILYFGARSGHGLWKSTDAGKSFQQVTSYTAVGTYAPDPTDTTGYNSDLQGLTFVTFDPTSGLTNGATSRIFVGTADNTTASVYVTEDAGSTWAAVPGQPGKYFPHKGRIQPAEKALYLTYADGTGPYDGTMGAVYRYDIANKVWKDITPVPAGGGALYFGFGGLGLDMKKPGTLVVASLNSWWPDAQFFRSNDSGTTWSRLWDWVSYPEEIYYYGLSEKAAPWIQTDFVDVDTKHLGWMVESFEIDPLDSDHFLYGTGLTLYGGFDLTSWDTVHNISIQCLASGMEEMSVQGVRSVPGGSELLVAVGDDSGFTFASKADLGTPPQHAWDGPMFTTSTGVDYAGKTVSDVVRIGNAAGTQQVAVSGDGGKTWSIDYAADTSKYGGTVAYSASGDTVLWSTAAQGVYVSKNSATFASVSSLPAAAVIAADRSNDSYFYGGSSATFYVSSNGGTTFTAGGTLAGATAVRDIATHPTTAGEIFVATDKGIFHSTNYGSSFTFVSVSLTNTYKVALGAGSSTAWNVYALGTGSSGPRLYGSADQGSTWTDIQGPSQGFGSLASCCLAGSGNVANQVYVGTNGRGVFYGQGQLLGAPSSSSSSLSSTSFVTKTTSKPATTSSTTQKTSIPATTTTTSVPTKTTTHTAPATSTVILQPHYGSCGGIDYNGPTTCASPYVCTEDNPYFYWCI